MRSDITGSESSGKLITQVNNPETDGFGVREAALGQSLQWKPALVGGAEKLMVMGVQRQARKQR